MIALLLSQGFSVEQSSEIITSEKYKYLSNFIQMPFVLFLFLLGVVSVLNGIGITIIKKSIAGIWFTGAGTVLVVFSLFMVAGFNGTAFYPSTIDMQSSLTIQNASSSNFTLKTMMYVSFMIPFVFAYIWYAWKSMNNEKLTEPEINAEEHKY